MTEWGVVGVIVVLIGLVTAIVAPIVKASKAMARLTVVLERTEVSLSKLEADNTASHRRLWEKNGEQDEAIKDHEVRIVILEHAK